MDLSIDESSGLTANVILRILSFRQMMVAISYFVTFDVGGDAMDDGDSGEAAAVAEVRNFFSGMS